jgi:hypothetical protein
MNPAPLRLMVAFEADALIEKFGSEAYAVACWRAEEASSETMAADWREVARTIARKGQKGAPPALRPIWVLLGRFDRPTVWGRITITGPITDYGITVTRCDTVTHTVISDMQGGRSTIMRV